MFPKTAEALNNADGQPEHLVVEYAKGQKRCFCSSGPVIIKRRLTDVPFSQHLICPVCNDDLRRWEKFWERQRANGSGKAGQGKGGAHETAKGQDGPSE